MENRREMGQRLRLADANLFILLKGILIRVSTTVLPNKIFHHGGA